MIRVAVFTLLLASLALAQTNLPPVAVAQAVAIGSGPLANDGQEAQFVWTAPISVPGAHGIQIVFDTAQLGSGRDRIVITNPIDGEVQELDTQRLQQWSNHSAWFNGDTVHVAMMLSPGSTGEVVVRKLYAGVGAGLSGAHQSLCGVDDRVLHTDVRTCRLVLNGATSCSGFSGFLVSDTSAICTSGLPLALSIAVAEFNAPALSGVNGCILHPPVADQYPIDLTSKQFALNGPGDDWGVVRLHPNSSGDTAYDNQGATFTLASSLPVAFPGFPPPLLRVSGYGSDSALTNYALQTATGNLQTYVGSEIRHLVDTNSGSQGSPILNESTGEVIGIATHGGCTAVGGFNSGTSIISANLQAAIASVAATAVIWSTVSASPSIFTTPPASDWVIAGVTSPSNWDIQIGTVSSTYSGGACDYLIADGNQGAVSPVNGVLTRVSGTDDATLTVEESATYEPGIHCISWDWPFQPSAVKLVGLNVPTAGLYRLRFWGNSTVSYRLYAPRATNAWIGASSAPILGSGTAASGSSQTLFVTPGVYALVMFGDNGPITPTLEPTHFVWSDTAEPTALLTPGVPAATGAVNARPLLLSPVPGAWNFLAYTRPTSGNDNWALRMEDEFFAGCGHLGDPALPDGIIAADGLAGPVPGSGQYSFFGPTGYLEHRSSVPLTLGMPGSITLSSSVTCYAWHFNVTTAGIYGIKVNASAACGGPFSGHEWSLFRPDGTSAWREPAVSVITHDSFTWMTLQPGLHAIAVQRFCVGTGPPSAVTIDVCGPPSALPSSPTSTPAGAVCHPFSMSLASDRWNVVGLASSLPGNWDLSMANGSSSSVSDEPGTATDFLVLDGRNVSAIAAYGNGLAARVSGTGGAIVEHRSATQVPIGPMSSHAWSTGQVIEALEFEVIQSGSYAVTLSGASSLDWKVFGAGIFVQWGPRSVATGNGTANGTTVTLSLTPGWYLLVVHRDGGGSGNASYDVLIDPPAAPAGTLSSLSPMSVTAGSPTFTLTATGTGFVPGAVVTWDGAALATTFVSTTRVDAIVPASLVAQPLMAGVRVVNPGSSVSNGISFVVDSPVPTLTSMAPTTAIVGDPAVTLICNGAGLTQQTTVFWDLTPLPTTYIHANRVTAQVAASLLQTSGQAAIRLSNPAPGGGASAGLVFTVANPAPTITSTNPIIGFAGSSNFPMIVTGTGFVPQSVVALDGTPLATTYVSGTQVNGLVLSSMVAAPGAFQITVTNPAPGGGVSAPVVYQAIAPSISSHTPTDVAVMAPTDPPVTVTLDGLRFLPWSVVYADGVALPTTWISPIQVTATLDPSQVLGLTRRGGVAIALQTGLQAFTNASTLR